jgi:glutaredoxin
MSSIQEDEARAKRINAENQAAINQEAKHHVSIIMYSASWCSVCRAARSYLQSASIPFTERDVDTDASAAAEVRRLNPRGSVPTFDVEGTPVIGFSRPALEQAIATAEQRR